MSEDLEIEENTKEVLQVQLSPVKGFFEIVQKKKRTHIRIDAITKVLLARLYCSNSYLD
jgi:hypothetical protein